MDKYGSMMDRLKEYLESEIKAIRDEMESSLKLLENKLQLEFKEKIAEEHRYLEKTIMDLEIKLNSKIEGIKELF